MHVSDHLVWNANPIIFNLGKFSLPIPIAIWGLVAAIILIFLGYPKLTPEKKYEQGSPPEPSAWKVWALIIGAFIAGQILFAILPSPSFQQIGPIRPRWYGVLFASAFLCGYFIMFHMYKNAGRTQEDLDRLLMYVLIATVIGARLGHIIFYDLGYYLSHPAQIIMIWHGGLASHGAAIGILLAMYFYVKKYKNMSFLWLADRVVVVVATGGAFIRVGNFMNSEIVGKPTHLPWGIIFARRTDLAMVPRHPSMLYEALLCLVTFIILWGIYKHYKNKPPEGSMFSTFLVLLFGGRFFLEYLKHHQAAFATGPFNMGQWLSIPLVLAGLWLIFARVRWKRPSDIPKSTVET